MVIYVDTAELDQIASYARDTRVGGFTTNPTLMKRAGVTDYEAYARKALKAAMGKPISLEVIANTPDKIYRQGMKLASFGKNVVVKVPITNTLGVNLTPTIYRLAAQGVKVNVTAVTTVKQFKSVLPARTRKQLAPFIVSLFMGRITDSGIFPTNFIIDCEYINFRRPTPTQLLWASVREPFNITQAERFGFDIITVPPAILEKAWEKKGADMEAESLALVKQFYADAKASGLKL
jgi:transaldolase